MHYNGAEWMITPNMDQLASKALFLTAHSPVLQPVLPVAQLSTLDCIPTTPGCTAFTAHPAICIGLTV